MLGHHTRGRTHRMLVTLMALAVAGALLAVPGSAAGTGAPHVAGDPPGAGNAGVAFPNFTADGSHLVRLLAGAFDPRADPLPAVAGIDLVDAAPSGPDYHLVQVAGRDFAGAQSAIDAAGGLLAGYVPDDTYMVRATADQIAAIAASAAVRWAGYYQPAWRIPVAVGAKVGLLDLDGTQTYRVYVFRADPEPGAVGDALAAIPGVRVVANATYVYEVEATAAEVPAMAAIPGVEWIGVERQVELHNANARWVNDTGVRDTYEATAPGRLTGAGQAAAVADTGVNYTYDLNGRAHVGFRDCDPGGANCKEARYTMVAPGGSTPAMVATQAHGTGHRKMVAYFDIAGSGPQPFDTSSHGSHTGGSVTGDQGNNGTWDGHDGLAPGAMHVHQNIGTISGGIALPSDDYQLWRQAYRPRNPASVPQTSPAAGNVADRANYVPVEDARTHNNSYGLIVPIVDEGSAVLLDRFVWDHEDMVIVFSNGNDGPEPFSIQSPAVAKNDLSSGASANGRQPMASIDSMASFSSHGPTGDGRFGSDLATPGQVVISAKGGTEDGYHVAQGTSMSAPVLTGLATLVRQYFFDGFGPAGGSGFGGGAADSARSHNPSAALVKATLVNGAERMRGWYTGDDGSQRLSDGQWPSAGQGFGRVSLANSLYFTGDATNNWYHDVWRDHPDAFTVADPLGFRDYEIEVAGGAPLDVTLAWTDAPNLAPAGTPSLVNNLDLFVESPSGAFYVGNNMNTRAAPQLAGAETIANVEAYDVRNNVERVRVLAPETGTWTIRVFATPVAVGNQGFALAASGRLGAGFVPGPGLFSDQAGSPAISNVEVEAASGDTAVVRFDTSEPTTATATVGATTYVDSYAISDMPGLAEGAAETSADFADKPMVGTSHEILLTGLTHGDTISIGLRATDLAGNTGSASVQHTNPANVFQPDAPDIGQLFQAGGTSVGGWGNQTQLYGGFNAGRGTLGAWAFRLPAGSIDPADVVGASVEFTSAHDWMIRYTQDPVLQVDLLDDAIEPLWGTALYEVVKATPAAARAYPESTHLRGAHQLYSFAFTCGDLQALRDSMADGMVAIRYDTSFVNGTGLFSADFGFNRRSNGPHLRPRLVLHTADQGHPGFQSCDPATPAPTISNVGVRPGLAPDSITVSWETDVPSDSLVLFREQGTPEWTQVGTPALTRVHHVQVFGLDPSLEYEFAVRSAACNGATGTDANAGEGYDFFVPPKPVAPSDDWFFHGLANDQAQKAALFATAPPSWPQNWRLDQTPPSGLVQITQTSTGNANTDFVGNPLTILWRGPFTGTIDADVELHLWWSTGNPLVVAQGGGIEVSFFADPSWTGSRVQPERRIGSGVGTLTFDATDTPTLNVTPITVQGTVQNELLVQIDAEFAVNDADLVVHYDSVDTPSGFKIPEPVVDPFPQRKLSGPQPAPSAGGTGVAPPPTRTGPASPADIAAGTAWCDVPGEGGEVVAVDDAYATDQDTQLVVAPPGVLGNDTGSGLTASLVTDVASGTLVLDADGSFTYDPEPAFHGSDSFVYQASDGTTTDEATVTITVRPVGGGGDKVTGGGYLLPVDGKKINFGFNAKGTSGGFSGHLTLVDKSAGAKVKLDTVTALGDVGAECGSVLPGPASAELAGTGTFNGAPAAFRVCVADLGEPGNAGSGGADLFYLECTSGCAYSTGDRTADDVIDGGNIQVHRSQAAATEGGEPAEAQRGGGEPGAAQGGEATVLILDPMLLTESVLPVEILTVSAYDGAGELAAGVAVSLESVGPDGLVTTLDAVTDATGVAAFTVTVLGGDVEHLARSGSLTSNAIDISGLV